ncbi:HD domain-containing protein [Nocardia huaxiensis]|uniref:HD domain-containing protein n=1 Tax=Nocardia huaxiensis TaxID=2755382 RepID=A0A7D6VMN8_9NOCA|nr:HD domain-containing protein [Nocardia huaxiensis]QLY33296.1 HD domain-containing protein [Nocardia huaxiensis]
MEAALSDLLTPLTTARREHTLEVGRKVKRVAHRLPENLRSETVVSAYLHDVGYGYPDTGFHPIDGANLLAARGFSPIVCNLVAFHSASTVEAEVRGIEAEVFDRFRLVDVAGLDRATDLVWWADMTTGPNGELFTIDQRLSEIRDRYEAGSIVRTAIDRSEPLLRGAVQRVEGSM